MSIFKEQIDRMFYDTIMEDGSTWRVPVSIIALNRAAFYAPEFGGDTSLSLEEDTGPLFVGDDYEIKDWAANNMNWSDVALLATEICDPPPTDFLEGWLNGEHVIIKP